MLSNRDMGLNSKASSCRDSSLVEAKWLRDFQLLLNGEETSDEFRSFFNGNREVRMSFERILRAVDDDLTVSLRNGTSGMRNAR